MMRHAVFLFLSSTAILACPAFGLAADDQPPPGLGDPGKLVSIAIETGRTQDGLFLLSGRDSSQQLVVTGGFDSGQQRDLTREVTYTVTPAGMVSVDAAGYVISLAEGEATIQAAAAPGIDATVRVRVTNIAQDLPINFPNRITPLFTKYGCNGGGCHGKSGGQNGFALSLLGFEPAEDYEYLVKEARGRRLFPSAPEQSLLLVKATAQVPHGGGQRLTTDSPSYRLLVRWMQQGMPYGVPDAPHVTHIEVFPKERLMQREGSQQLVVVAHYSDGASEDVTRTTTFDSNDKEMAEASSTGLITTSKLTGSVAVMARYQGQVAVFRATIPLGVPVDNLP
nr:Ig-like domain-containing protein [Pirellulaceae bacterium]